MSTTTATGVGAVIASGVGMTCGYAKMLLEGVDAGIFAMQAEGVDANHPAWVFGHLASYPAVLLPALGCESTIPTPDDAWGEMFGYGSPCKNDPKGEVYPSMETLTTRFFESHEALRTALPSVDDAVFAKPNEMFLQEYFSTLGGLVNFMCSGHTMMHLGQISTWRRTMDLGSAM